MCKTLLVCCGTGCLASGSAKVLQALEAAINNLNADAKAVPVIKSTGCSGLCEDGPIIRILPDEISYYKVKPADAEEIIQRTVLMNEPVSRLLYTNEDGKEVLSQKENPFYSFQKKIVLRNVGEINPLSIDDYLERGGYEALKKAVEMEPIAILSEVEDSGLRGRGGAGFPTGKKWRQAYLYDNKPKYVVCNGDEGDPGAFMDGSILEGDPHSVIEGMIICALAIGAEQGFMYIRDEYVLARKNVSAAISDAYRHGILGGNIINSGKRFDIEIVRGGGAFVCGESTALMASIEGKVGEPRAKYIRSVQSGLWGCPTVLNNVETLANIPVIISRGGRAFSGIGTENSTGTKVFAMVGKIKKTGLVEVPMGTTLRHLIYDIGGGIAGGRNFKAVQTGGPSGGCIPASMLDLEADFDTLSKYGSMMGSGGMIIMDEMTCMVEVARYYVAFLSEESCGKCTPCREGLRRMLQILTDICEGKGREDDITQLEILSEILNEASLCALGRTASNPVMSTLKYFRDEYEAHIKEKRCPAGVCKELTIFKINNNCSGCTSCLKICPTGAIMGEVKKQHSIDPLKCVSCGSCVDACKFNAIEPSQKEVLSCRS